MIGAKTKLVEAFWQSCRASRKIGTTDYHACTLSDPQFLDPDNEHLDLSDQPRLIAARRKCGTAHLEMDFARNGVARRQVGDYWVLLNDDGTPMCLVRVTGVEVAPFHLVPEAWAAVEGEGDCSLEWWQEAHRQYYQRQCALWGIDWREDYAVVCERWDLLETAG